MTEKIGYYPENSGSYSLPANEPRVFGGEEFEPGEDNHIDDGWWNAYCVPGSEVFVMSRYGVLRLIETPKITVKLNSDDSELTGLPSGSVLLSREDSNQEDDELDEVPELEPRKKRSPKVGKIEPIAAPVVTVEPDLNAVYPSLASTNL